uniref:Slc22a-3 n=1 Tax=Schmidtea mediterranea TaxID=79327 RepID=A0A0H3YJ39_SCHMD|nr:slc22a-3 [Schmidtea mediterranea]
MDPEKCLDELGGKNIWILKWFLLISFMKSLPCVFSMYSFQFTGVKPDSFHCALPPNVSRESMIPKERTGDKWEFSSCNQFQSQDNSTIIPCQNGYNYTMKYFTSSIVTEWDLVCDRAILNALATSSFFVMSFFGAIISCSIADRFGRKVVLITAFMCLNLCEFAQTYITSIYVLIVFKLLAGIFQQGCFISGFTMTIELFSLRNRSNACLADTFSWTFSSFILIIYIYFIRDWRNYFFWTSITMLPFCLVFYHLPESIRWMMAKDQTKNAQILLKTATLYSNPPLPEKTFENYDKYKRKQESEKLPHYNVLHIFRETLLLRYQLINSFVWFTTAMTYYGVQVKVVEIGNPFLNFFLSSLVEIPANILCFPIANKYGRKITIGLTNFLVGFSLFMGYILWKYLDSPWPAIIVFLVGKMLNTGIFNLIFMHVSEFFPTTLRTTAVGMSSSCARIGASFGAMIFQITLYHDSIAFVIVIGCCLLTGVLVFCLPETYRKKMPTSIEEIKQWVAHKPIISFH